MTSDSAFTGLEAAIVLIAFVVVAGVFAYVTIGAGFFTTQKSQETVYKGVEQASSNIQMTGAVYGIDSGSTATINKIQFGIGLAPGSPPIDIEKMIIVVTQPDNNNIVQQLRYSAQATAGSEFGVINSVTQVHDRALSGKDQETITILLGTGVNAHQKIIIEMRPVVGAALSFSRTAPATIARTQPLY
jgi:flagellin FlaB